VGTHQEFLAGLKQVATLPQLVLADIHLPGCSGLTELAGLRQRLPTMEIVILSGHLHGECVLEALREGAAGYLEYLVPLPVLKQSLLQVAAGGAVISPLGDAPISPSGARRPDTPRAAGVFSFSGRLPLQPLGSSRARKPQLKRTTCSRYGMNLNATLVQLHDLLGQA
jgi:DNA-binding NarL/FixJ family response regulator